MTTHSAQELLKRHGIDYVASKSGKFTTTSTDLICLMSMLSVPSPMAIHFLSVLPLASVPVRPSIDATGWC